MSNQMNAARDRIKRKIIQIIEDGGDDHEASAESILSQIADTIENVPVQIPIKYYHGSKVRMSWATAIAWVIWFRGIRPVAKRWQHHDKTSPT